MKTSFSPGRFWACAKQRSPENLTKSLTFQASSNGRQGVIIHAGQEGERFQAVFDKVLVKERKPGAKGYCKLDADLGILGDQVNQVFPIKYPEVGIGGYLCAK